MAQHLTRYDSSNTLAWSIALSERQTRRFHAVSVASQAGLPPCCGVRGDDNRPHTPPVTVRPLRKCHGGEGRAL